MSRFFDPIGRTEKIIRLHIHHHIIFSFKPCGLFAIPWKRSGNDFQSFPHPVPIQRFKLFVFHNIFQLVIIIVNRLAQSFQQFGFRTPNAPAQQTIPWFEMEIIPGTQTFTATLRYISGHIRFIRSFIRRETNITINAIHTVLSLQPHDIFVELRYLLYKFLDFLNKQRTQPIILFLMSLKPFSIVVFSQSGQIIQYFFHLLSVYTVTNVQVFLLSSSHKFSFCNIIIKNAA